MLRFLLALLLLHTHYGLPLGADNQTEQQRAKADIQAEPQPQPHSLTLNPTQETCLTTFPESCRPCTSNFDCRSRAKAQGAANACTLDECIYERNVGYHCKQTQIENCDACSSDGDCPMKACKKSTCRSGKCEQEDIPKCEDVTATRIHSVKPTVGSYSSAAYSKESKLVYALSEGLPQLPDNLEMQKLCREGTVGKSMCGAILDNSYRVRRTSELKVALGDDEEVDLFSSSFFAFGGAENWVADDRQDQTFEGAMNERYKGSQHDIPIPGVDFRNGADFLAFMDNSAGDFIDIVDLSKMGQEGGEPQVVDRMEPGYGWKFVDVAVKGNILVVLKRPACVNMGLDGFDTPAVEFYLAENGARQTCPKCWKEKGRVVIYDVSNIHDPVSDVEAGYWPTQVTITPDAEKVLVTNQGLGYDFTSCSLTPSPPHPGKYYVEVLDRRMPRFEESEEEVSPVNTKDKPQRKKATTQSHNIRSGMDHWIDARPSDIQSGFIDDISNLGLSSGGWDGFHVFRAYWYLDIQTAGEYTFYADIKGCVDEELGDYFASSSDDCEVTLQVYIDNGMVVFTESPQYNYDWTVWDPERHGRMDLESGIHKGELYFVSEVWLRATSVRLYYSGPDTGGKKSPFPANRITARVPTEQQSCWFDAGNPTDPDGPFGETHPNSGLPGWQNDWGEQLIRRETFTGTLEEAKKACMEQRDGCHAVLEISTPMSGLGDYPHNTYQQDFMQGGMPRGRNYVLLKWRTHLRNIDRQDVGNDEYHSPDLLGNLYVKTPCRAEFVWTNTHPDRVNKLNYDGKCIPIPMLSTQEQYPYVPYYYTAQWPAWEGVASLCSKSPTGLTYSTSGPMKGYRCTPFSMNFPDLYQICIPELSPLVLRVSWEGYLSDADGCVAPEWGIGVRTYPGLYFCWNYFDGVRPGSVTVVDLNAEKPSPLRDPDVEEVGFAKFNEKGTMCYGGDTQLEDSVYLRGDKSWTVNEAGKNFFQQFSTAHKKRSSKTAHKTPKALTKEGLAEVAKKKANAKTLMQTKKSKQQTQDNKQPAKMETEQFGCFGFPSKPPKSQTLQQRRSGAKFYKTQCGGCRGPGGCGGPTPAMLQGPYDWDANCTGIPCFLCRLDGCTTLREYYGNERNGGKIHDEAAHVRLENPNIAKNRFGALASPTSVFVTDDGVSLISLSSLNGLAIMDTKGKQNKQPKQIPLNIGAEESTGPEFDVAGVACLGYKDMGLKQNSFDASAKDGAAALRNWQVWAMYQPKGVEAISIGDYYYIFTANEGQVNMETMKQVKDLHLSDELMQEQLGHTKFNKNTFFNMYNEYKPNGRKDGPGPKADIQSPTQLGGLWVFGDLGASGSSFQQLVMAGARSMSVWKIAKSDMLNLDSKTPSDAFKFVADTGNEMERALKETNARTFNSVWKFDENSVLQGPQPTRIVIGNVFGERTAFVSLQGGHAVAVYNIDDPEQPEFVRLLQYTGTVGNSAVSGDIGPTKMTFIAKEDSPTGCPVLLVVCGGSAWRPGSGNMAVWEFKYNGQCEVEM